MKTKNNVTPGSAALRTALAFFTAILLFAACEDATKPSDLTPPAEVGSLNAAPGNGQVILTWADPADADFHHVEITVSPTAGGGGAVSVAKGAQSSTITGLTNGTEYTFTVKTVDATENKSAGVAKTATPAVSPDTTPPAEVGSLNAEAGDGQVVLTWTDPGDGDFDHVEITVSSAAGDGEAITVAKGAQSRTVPGLVNGTEYSFTVKTVDGTGNKSAGVSTTATPVGPPDTTPPAEATNLSAEAGDGQVLLAWTPPADEDFNRVEITFTPAAVGIEQPITVTGAQTHTVAGLVNGTEYTFTVKTLDATGNKSAGVTKTATPVVPVLNTIEKIATYLASTEGGNSTDAPVPLTVTLNLTDNWANLLSAIQTAGKYVELDLTNSAMTGMTGIEGEFDPGTANTGESLITSLTLPSAATAIKAGTSSAPTFRYFTNLKTIRSSAVITIGNSAFRACASLTTATFPAATNIGSYAFQECAALTTVSFPLATSIGSGAFRSCTSLTTVSFPLATSTGINAFAGCTVLIAVSFPLATSIGGNAFSSCAALTTVDFPLATTTGESAFYNCTALTTVSFPELISLGNSAFYQCTALTTVSFPKLTTIGDYPFRNTGDKTLTIILPQAAPALSSIGIIFDTYAKTVIIKTPASRTGYDATWETNFKKAFGNSATVTLSFENL